MASRKRTTKKAKASGRPKRRSVNVIASITTPISGQFDLQRPNYFAGKLLTVDDFRAEQEYFLARDRRRNRLVVGWGVVSGLDVKATSASQVVVEPGYAIDCAGNEIYVSSQVMLTVSAASNPQYVALRYVETLTNPVPVLTPDEGVTTPSEYSRIREGFRLDVLNVDPSKVHDDLSGVSIKVAKSRLWPCPCAMYRDGSTPSWTFVDHVKVTQVIRGR